jgi:hypothetical protein
MNIDMHKYHELFRKDADSEKLQAFFLEIAETETEAHSARAYRKAYLEKAEELTRGRKYVFAAAVLCLLMGVILGLSGCGDDNTTTTNSVAVTADGDVTGDVGISQNELPEENGPTQEECDRCIGNPNDGVTDEECLDFLGCE